MRKCFRKNENVDPIPGSKVIPSGALIIHWEDEGNPCSAVIGLDLGLEIEFSYIYSDVQSQFHFS